MNWFRFKHIAHGMALVLAIAVGAIISVACGSTVAGPKPLDVVTTIYPVQYFASQVAGGLISVAPLADNIVDAHNFEPTTAQVIRLNEATAVLYLNTVLEEWLLPFIANSANGNFVALIDDAVFADAGRVGTTHNHGAIDLHIWLDPVLMLDLVQRISNQLAMIDPANSATYQANASDLSDRLTSLHNDFQTTLTPAACVQSEIVTDQNFLSRLALRYGFEAHSIQADFAHATTISATDLANTIELINQSGIKHILVATNASVATIQPVLDNTSTTVLEVYQLEQKPNNSLDYFDYMRANLEALATALQCQ